MPGGDIDVLWESSCTAWGFNNVRVNSAMQLFTHDLEQKSNPIFFNDDGRTAVLSTAPNEPWAASPGEGGSQ